jgi:hypothetical protein
VSSRSGNPVDPDTFRAIRFVTIAYFSRFPVAHDRVNISVPQ